MSPTARDTRGRQAALEPALETLEKLDKAGVIDRASALFRLATVAVSPAVVNVRTQRIVREGEGKTLLPGGMRPPVGGPGYENGLGSGVIIDKEHGYVVTNYHVVKDADQITVRVSQGTDVNARLVGQDPKTDLAVLQIKTDVRVAAEWGDSDKLEIGDWVLAIGSPFALDHSVTVGIVSATGRNNLPIVSDESYQDFIQTDAAINPGNSGGPLIDLNGKVVGINAAIYTQTGGYEGIGFAVPSLMARRVVDSLIKSGKVIRGYLGIVLQPLNGQLARAFKLPSVQGAPSTSCSRTAPRPRPAHGLAFVTTYSGMDTVLGLSLHPDRPALYPFFGTLLGWLGVALTGSDTGSQRPLRQPAEDHRRETRARPDPDGFSQFDRRCDGQDDRRSIDRRRRAPRPSRSATRPRSSRPSSSTASPWPRSSA